MLKLIATIKVFCLYVILGFVLMTSSSCKLSRFVWYNFADIKDHEKFRSRELKAKAPVFDFYQVAEPRAPRQISFGNEPVSSFAEFLEKNNTVAFLIIRNDSIQYENYFKGYDKASIVPSFSMAKSITSILIGCAIDDGLIKSVNDPVIQYLPELKDNGFEKVTIEHVLQMTSGLKFSEGYSNPFSEVATFYYGTNLRKAVSKLKTKHAPGLEFEYLSGNTQILGAILDRVLKGRSVTDYLQEKLWTPLGMEYDASWSIDKKKNGMEKTFCCINAPARDFAKIGRLYLNKGNWNGQQLVSKAWVQQSTKVDTSAGSAWYYQYQWWLPSKTGDFMAQGILGQYIYVNPAKNLIMVRLGKNRGNADWSTVFTEIAKGY